MKKEYNLNIKYDDTGDECEVDEYLDEEEIVFTIDDRDIICPDEMSKIIMKLDNNILGLAQLFTKPPDGVWTYENL